MKAIKNQLIQIMYESISQLNGHNTEEDLNMVISKVIVEDKLRGSEIIDKIYDTEIDTEENIDKGAWVYCTSSIEDFVFQPYNTIAEAVRQAIKLIGAKIICNGVEIVFDTINDKEAYYIDNSKDIAKIVTI